MSSKTRNFFLLSRLLLVLCPVLLYAGLTDNPLFFDSKIMLTKAMLTGPIGGLELFTSLRRLTFLSFQIVARVFGTSWSYQLAANILLHVLNVLLIRTFLSRLFRVLFADSRDFSINEVSAFLAAFAFALHPVAVYAVGDLIQRSILLATTFSLLSLRFFLNGLVKKRIFFFYVAVGFYLLAMASKEHVVLLPLTWLVLTLLVDKTALNAKGRWLKELAPPFLLCFLIALKVASLSADVLGTVYEPAFTEIESGLTAPEPTALPLLNAINQAFLFFRYVFIWTLPHADGMAIDVLAPFPEAIWSWPEMLGLAGFFALPFFLIPRLKKRDEFATFSFGLLFAWTTFLTEFTVVRLSEVFVLYRSYFWMCFLFAGLRWLLPALARRLVFAKAVLPFLVMIGLTALAVTALERLSTFETPRAVWQDALKQTGDKRVAAKAHRIHYNLGQALQDEGDVVQAKVHYEAALQLNPRFVPALNNLGVLAATTGRLAEAKTHYLAILKIQPRSVDAILGLAHLATLEGRHQDALALLTEALKMNPQHEWANNNYGNALRTVGRLDDAILAYSAALKINPDNADAHLNLGITLLDKGQTHDAMSHFQKALALKPYFAEAHFNLGNAFMRLNDPQSALAHYAETLHYKPSFADAHYNSGVAFEKLKRYDDALKAYQAAFLLRPESELYRKAVEDLKKMVGSN